MLTIPSSLSEDAPKPVRRAGLGDRFRYWRGTSGRRYLFSAVPAEALPDFRNVVVIFAEPLGDGRFAARTISVIDSAGGGIRHCRPLPSPKSGIRAFVHFLAANGAECRRLADDLSAAALKLAA